MNVGSNLQTSVLTSWKDIARYMGKGVRTVQRWEQDFGLPVRRPHGSNKKAVLARPSDLDAWVALRCSSRNHSAFSGCEHKGVPPRLQASLAVLTTLNAGIQTSRLLRDNNVALLVEMKTALAKLQEQLLLIHRAS